MQLTHTVFVSFSVMEAFSASLHPVQEALPSAELDLKIVAALAASVAAFVVVEAKAVVEEAFAEDIVVVAELVADMDIVLVVVATVEVAASVAAKE